MSKANIIFLIAIVPVIVFAVWFMRGESFLPYAPENIGLSALRIGNVPIHVEIADTDEERIRGLSGRDVLLPNNGLLFIFDEPGIQGIWMKDMRFAIDIIWIAPFSSTSSSGGRDTYRVVDIKRNAMPESFPEIFYPVEEALYVLEVNAGFTDLYNISVGDAVHFSE